MANIKNIIFDYGDVIFNIEHSFTIQAFIELGITNAQELFGHKAQADFFDLFEKGEINASEFYDTIRKLANKDLTDEEIKSAWNTLLIGIPEGNLDLLLQAKSKYRTFLLSNNNEIHYEWILNYLQAEWNVPNMSSFFEKDYYSHLMGMRKPDAEIFEYVLNMHDLKPEETLFIDDSPQHIATANQLGIVCKLKSKHQTLEEVLLGL